MSDQNELSYRKILMNNGRVIPALGFGTLIPDASTVSDVVVNL